MPNYKVIHTGVGPWKQGDVVSADQINADKVKGLGGVDRLKRLGGIEETTDEVTVGVAKPPVSPNDTKGDNTEAGDTVEKRANRRGDAVGPQNDGTRTSSDPETPLAQAGGDAAAAQNPSTGAPGTVTKVGGGKKVGR
jgi:hypothetical protein